jgi:hypothetical protein
MPTTGYPLPNEYIDVEMDTVRTIELVGPKCDSTGAPLPTSAHFLRFSFTNGDTINVYLAPANDARTAEDRRDALRAVLRGRPGASIDVFRSTKDAEQASGGAHRD